MTADTNPASGQRWRTLIVDDERLARSELRRLLLAHQQIDIVGEAADGTEALALVEQLRPDLAFLDIQMPGINGIALAVAIDALSQSSDQGKPALRCQLVFCTALAQFALDAFALNALDYLLKPVEPARLAHTLARLPAQAAALVADRLPVNHQLLLKFGELARLVSLPEIERFESLANHVAVHTRFGTAFLISTLNRIEQRLDPGQFMRVNRQCILRLAAIATLSPAIGAGMIATMQSGAEVEISRRAALELKAKFEI